MAARKRLDNIIIEDAEIIWANFSGEERNNNRAGARNFCVKFSDPAVAQKLLSDGWNVKHHNPREDNDNDEFDFLQVSIRFDPFPPEIVWVTKNANIPVNESNIGELDGKQIIHADVEITPYFWTYNGKDGIKAMLKTMYIEVRQNPFADKYARSNGAIHPNDYSVMRSQDIKNQKPPQGDSDEMPFEI